MASCRLSEMFGKPECRSCEIFPQGGFFLLPIGSKIDELRVDGSLDAFRKDLEHFAHIGIEAVEIPVHGLDLIRRGVLEERRVRQVREILKDFDFIYTVHSPNPLNLMDQASPELHMAVFRASLEFTQAIGSNILVYHAGRFVPEETFAIQKEHSISENLAQELLEIEQERISRLAKEFPTITICLENARPYLHHSPYCYGERLELLKDQVKKIARPNVRINLDLGHLYLASHFFRFDPIEATQEVSPLISHTHVHDNFGGAAYYHQKIQTHQIPFGQGDSHMPVGWGSVPIASLLAAYFSSYRGILMMELRSRYFAHIEESKENLRKLVKSIPPP
jgi:sugar phosphate isomerase/epimerase